MTAATRADQVRTSSMQPILGCACKSRYSGSRDRQDPSIVATSSDNGRVHHAGRGAAAGPGTGAGMFGLILRAIASRRAPAVTLFLLTILSAGAAAAAPQYVATTTRDLAAATAEAAPVDARTVTLRREIDQREVRPDAVEQAEREVRDALG